MRLRLSRASAWRRWVAVAAGTALAVAAVQGASGAASASGHARAAAGPHEYSCPIFPASTRSTRTSLTRRSIPTRRSTSPRSAPAGTCTPTSAPTRATASPTRSSAPTSRGCRSIHRIRRRIQPRPLPGPAQRARGGRGRKATATCSSCRRAAASCMSSTRTAQRRRLGSRVRRRLQPAQQRAAPGRLDLGRRGRPADLPPARPLPRGRSRADRPRAAGHRGADPAGYIHPATHFASDSSDPTCRRWGCACA